MYLELTALIGIFLLSLVLILKKFDYALYIALVLSVLLHKELFSFYRWDLLPIRAFMAALILAAGTKISIYIFKTRDLKSIVSYLKDPFIFSIFALWLIRGLSIISSKNLQASILLYGFFTGVAILSVWIYLQFRNRHEEIKRYLDFYILLVFGLTIFGYFQLALYQLTGKIIGALWNIPGNIARVGATFWDVNHYAALLGSLLPIVAVFFITSSTWKARIKYGLIMLSTIGAYFLTNSRSGWIVGLVAFITFCLLLTVKKIGSKGVLYVLLALLLIAAPFVYMYSQKDSKFRAEVKQYFHYRLDSFDSHFMLLTGTYQIFSKYPILGGGYGSFFEHFSKTKIAPEYFGRDPAALNTRVPAHTIWGELLSETGVLGLNAFLLIIAVLLSTHIYVGWKQTTFKSTLIYFAMASTILGLLVAGIFYSYNSEFFWLILSFYFVYSFSSIQSSNRYLEIFKFLFDNKKLPLIIVSTLAVLLLFVNLGKNHLIAWDEAIYAKIAKNVMQSNQLVPLRWDSAAPWFEKPPFYMWSAALFMYVLGATALAARLPSAILGLVTVITVYKLGSKQFSKTAGFIASLSLLTNLSFLYYARASMIDVSATCFIMLAIYFYSKARSEFLFANAEKHILRWWAVSGIFVGFAVMTKGVVGLLPFACFGLFEFYLLVTKRISLAKNIKSYLLLLVSFLAIAAPWHIFMYSKYGMSFFNSYIGYHVIERATHAIEDKGKPFLWYFEVIKVYMRIWFVLLIPAFIYTLYKVYKKSLRHVFLLLSASVIFLFFSIAKSKLTWYIIPVYPLLGLLIGAFISEVYAAFSKVSPLFKNTYIKVGIFYLFTIFMLSYTFITREKMFIGNSTGAPSRLLILKDQFFGVNQKVYVDRLDYPLPLFYSDGPFEILDFDVSQGRYPKVGTDEMLVLLTKKGRFSKMLPNRNGEAIVLREDGDYVLWYFEIEPL